MKFSYKRYGPNTLRPVIPIKLCRGTRSFGYEVLVDSGADLCIFHAEIGEILGLDIEKGKAKEVFGVGGKASVYYIHPITLDVGGWKHTIKAGFMPEVTGRVMPYGIVGQQGFFDTYVVTFDLIKEQVELKARTKS
ncbi:MAG: hypothetical protein KBC35_04180 [Candidatus Pacebacteria bacterium]|nr:hypothetical protein [Candidatus Paceibacterota bacterium]